MKLYIKFVLTEILPTFTIEQKRTWKGDKYNQLKDKIHSLKQDLRIIENSENINKLKFKIQKLQNDFNILKNKVDELYNKIEEIKNSSNSEVAFSFLRYCFEEVKQSANYII